VAYTFVLVDLKKGEQKNPEYLEKHPFGVVPCIDDDGFILYESRAICRYLAAKYASQGPKLVPTDLQGAALFEQAVSVESSYYTPHTGGIMYEQLIKPMRGLAPDEARYTELVGKLNATLDVYDALLGKQKYLAGDEFTLVDIFHMPSAKTLPAAGVDLLEKKPNVARWWKEVTARPSWVAAQADVKT